MYRNTAIEGRNQRIRDVRPGGLIVGKTGVGPGIVRVERQPFCRRVPVGNLYAIATDRPRRLVVAPRP
jgi:hypothetical protein